MERPLGKLRRRTDAGIARGPGIAVAAVTAALVFVIGLQIFPARKAQPPAPPIPAPVVETPPPAPPPAVDAVAADAGAATKAPDAGATSEEKAPAKKDEVVEVEKSDKAEKPAADETATEERKPIDKQRQADKDLAREAWRRNRPDISVNGSKTSIMVPIKGSIKGADFKIIDKKRKVIVTLPKAVSMVTLRVYNLKHPSFKKVWIDQDEANAQPKDGSKLRFILSQSFDPQVEITDDFVRVTIRRVESATDEERAEKHERAEKRSERTEKRTEPSDEPAPAEKD
jgi:hypothetical protein